MDWGMRNRLSRIIKPGSGRTVMLAVDHGYFLGPTSGLEQLGQTVAPLLPYADTLMLTRGALRNEIDPSTDIPIVLRVSSGNSVLKEDLSDEQLAVSIEEALRLNVSGVAFSIYVGSPHEHQTLMEFSRLINVAESYGVPVLAVTAVGKEMVRNLRYLSLASRMAAELGARFVKTYYCEGFEKLVEAVPVPVVIAGGKKVPEADALQRAYDAIRAGASGVDMGRNIFQAASPVAMIQAVGSVVHKETEPDEAYALYKQLKAELGDEGAALSGLGGDDSAKQ